MSPPSLPPEAQELARAWSRGRWVEPRDLGTPPGAWLTAPVAWALATRPAGRREWFAVLAAAGAFAAPVHVPPDELTAGVRALAGFGRARSLRWVLAHPGFREALAASAEPWQWWDRGVWAAAFASNTRPGAADACLRALLDTGPVPAPAHVLRVLAESLNEAAVRGRLDSVDRLLVVGAPLEGTPDTPTALQALLTRPPSAEALRHAVRAAWRVFDRLLEAGALLEPARGPGIRALGQAVLAAPDASAFAVARWNATLAAHDARVLEHDLGAPPSKRASSLRL